MKHTLLIPAAGASSRFPNMRPKWLLTHPNGNLMVAEAIRGLQPEGFDRILLVVLAEHEQKYGFRRGVQEQFEELGWANRLEIIELPEITRSQPETVAKGLRAADVEGPFCIKDTDNYFRAEAKPVDFVTYCDLDQLALVNAANKSYVSFNERDLVTNIVEKQIISKSFCTGLYGFSDAERFLMHFERLKDEEGLFVSHVIFDMLLAKREFLAVPSEDYADWGTLKDWDRFKAQYATLFIDIDGVLIENSGQYFSPRWGETKGIRDNIDAVNRLYASGKVQVILTTSRRSTYRQATLAQLEREGVRYHTILFDLHHGRRVVINDYSATNPYRSCDAINIRRNATELGQMMDAVLGMPENP